jgi:hypothetical protein
MWLKYFLQHNPCLATRGVPDADQPSIGEDFNDQPAVKAETQ